MDVLETEPFPTPPANDEEGQRFYLKRLLGWAQDLGLKVRMFHSDVVAKFDTICYKI